VIGQGLRQRGTYQPGDALAQRTVEPFDMSSPANSPGGRTRSSWREDACVDRILIGVDRGLSLIHGGDFAPERLPAQAAAVADVKDNGWARHGRTPSGSARGHHCPQARGDTQSVMDSSTTLTPASSWENGQANNLA
jgi:hypothetical protein